MDSCAYLINTTPKYFYLLPLHIALLHRYSNLPWPIYIATEARELLPELDHKVNILDLSLDKEGFWDSRAEAVRMLPPHIKYVFPIQEDFLLEGRPMNDIIYSAIDILEKHPVSSMRLMPCPGPKGTRKFLDTPWLHLDYDIDSLVFTYQATIWRREDYVEFMELLLTKVTAESQNRMAVKVNLAEIDQGQKLLKSLGKVHLAWPREGAHPNAVYLCPWPYRPTAVVRGTLEPWAAELMNREM